MEVSSELVSAVVAQLKGANEAQVNEAIRKAEAQELAAFVAKHIRPIIDDSYPAVFGLNASKNHANFGTFVTAAATLVAGKLIADAIRECGGAIMRSAERASAKMTTV